MVSLTIILFVNYTLFQINTLAGKGSFYLSLNGCISLLGILKSVHHSYIGQQCNKKGGLDIFRNPLLDNSNVDCYLSNFEETSPAC